MLLEQWPALSERFGLHPWDADRLTDLEWEVYLESLKDGAGG